MLAIQSSADISPGSEADALSDENNKAPTPPEQRTATVSHMLTNVVILQGLLFELAALVQVRAGMFDEVQFV